MDEQKLNIIIPCAGVGSRLNLPYSKEIHRVNYENSLIDFSLNLCFRNKNLINKIIIVTKPSKKDLISYLDKWKKNFEIKICFFNENYFEWAGSIMSAINEFSKKNVVLLPDTLITEYKNNNLLRSMVQNLETSDVCFALKKEKNKNILCKMGALNVKNNKITNFCDKPIAGHSQYNCYWTSFGFKKKNGVKLLKFMTNSIKGKKVDILDQNFTTSFFYVKNYLDLGTWKSINNFSYKFK